MKALRSPFAIAAAAVLATPPAGAQPISIRPPAPVATTPATAPPTPPAQPRAPVTPAVTPSAPASSTTNSPGGDLHGTSPLPTDLTIAAAAPPPPPPPPPAAPPAPPPPVVAAAAPPAPPPPPRVAPAPSASVSVGVQGEYTRLAFLFQGATSVTPALEGNRLDLRFSRAADIDLADLRATPPRYVREVRRVSAAGAPLRLQVTLDYGVRQRNFTDGNRVVVDLLPPDAGVQDAASGSGNVPIPARAPVSGTAHVQVIEEANDTRINVQWPAPARAAAFRRGEAIWLLFDASGRIDLTGVTRAGRRHEDITVVHGDGVIGLRIPAPPEIQVSAVPSDNAWAFTLSARAPGTQAASAERQVAADGHATLRVNFGREGVVRWINDPEIGDRIGVALLGGPARGVDTRRATLEAAILPAAHGAVIEPRADGVTAIYDGGVLSVSRGQGLIAASATSPTPAPTALQAGLNQALLDQSGGAAASGPTQAGLTLVQVRNRIDELERRAAEEGVREGAPVDARMALARFLLQNDFAAEALGALRIVGINQGALVELDPEYRLMRGAANVMMGRVAAAQPDLSASALANNPSAALWRGYGAFLQQDWPTARSELERGAGALEELSPAWRGRFQLALARATLELGDLPAAEAASNGAMGEATDQSIRLAARLIQARLLAARSDLAHALPMLDQLSQVDDEEVAVQASVEAISLRRQSGVMRAVDAIEPLEALRFRWRGDATELEVVGMLGDVYSEQGRWREALGVMRTVADRYPNNPAARQLRADMSTVFERLFLDGEADQLQPIEALGLFYEFSDLTPVGPNGDRIVRLLAGRLVNVDLLEQAAQLLQHQVDERVNGMNKAQVAADLAAIYLMDHKPDQALVALASSRQPNMPQMLLADRRILEARALLDLGRLDGAVELVERDRSEDAQRVRADAAWRSHDWDRAAVELRSLLAMRDHAQPLDEGGRQAVLRQAVALTLDGNDDAVRALYREYAGDMANTPEADAFEVVASGISADGAAIRDVARAVARTDLLDRFLQRLRTRMTADANTPHPAAPSAPNAPNTPAAPPPAAAALPTPNNRATPPAASSTPTA